MKDNIISNIAIAKPISMTKDYSEIQNTFIANQNQYRSILTKYVKERNVAYLIALVMFIVMLLSVGITTYLATQIKVQAIIFNQDGQFIGIPNTKVSINNELIVANQLVSFISSIYEVPLDQASKQHNITKILSMTDEHYFTNHLLPIIKDNFINYKDQQVEVRVTYIKPINNIWNIDFDTYMANTKLKSYSSRISFKQDLNLDTNDKMLNNPLGIYITNIETGEKLQ